MDKYAILINTTDTFEDCWEAFFTLFSVYWPNFKGEIYLNTEYKEYKFKGLNIKSLKTCEVKQDAHKITWSECLLRALDKIDSEVILYMQEDYFLKDFVHQEIIDNYARLMIESDIDCIHLTDQGVKSGQPSPAYQGLYTVPKKDKDRISCQAALWKKDVLKTYLRTYESGWNFEWWGSKRAAILNHNFYVVDNNQVQLNHFEIIPYVFTGVIGGRWKAEVVPLFKKHDIVVDFAKRGFYTPGKKSFIKRLKLKIRRLPVEIRSRIDLIRLSIAYKK